MKAPRLILGWSLQLEAELEPVSQRAQLRVSRSTADPTDSPTVHAPVRISEIHMVKYVIELELELSLRPFRDAEILEQG